MRRSASPRCRRAQAFARPSAQHPVPRRERAERPRFRPRPNRRSRFPCVRRALPRPLPSKLRCHLRRELGRVVLLRRGRPSDFLSFEGALPKMDGRPETCSPSRKSPFWGRPSGPSRDYTLAMAVAPEALAARGLYERHERRVYSYCLHQLGAREEAEDAVQTTFLHALRGLRRGTVPRVESAWLLKIARNVCLRRWETRGRERRFEVACDPHVLP